MTSGVEAQFSSFVEAAPDAMIWVDDAGCMRVVNTQALWLFGYERDELLGQRIEILVPDHARDSHPRHRARYVADPRPRPMGAAMELAARRKDGSEFPAEISLSAVQVGGRMLVSAAIRDVTERLEAQAERERLRASADRAALEAQLQQSRRLESLGRLAGGVAHDFNNLLAVILNYTAFVSEEVRRSLDEADLERLGAVSDDLAQITKAAERASELTHQLLSFARREIVNPEPLSLNDIVRDIEALLDRTLSEDIELVSTLDPSLWSVMADAGQIEQILMNLVFNARDAMPSGGRLEIVTANLVHGANDHDLGPLPQGRYVRLTVADDGHGMSSDVAERAFEPFFTTKSKGEGSGLGLATVYGIATQAGGSASIVSSPGNGARVSVVLPATDAAPATVPTTSSDLRASRGGGETVLVVEDEPAMLEVTSRMLTRAGYEVLRAGGAEDAIDVAERHPGHIDLLLTDVVMPQLSGPDVADVIRARRKGVRVLFMSGYAQPFLGLPDEAGTAGPAARVRLLAKPFTEQVLLDQVREVLDAVV